MSARLDVRGKSREEIEQLLATARRSRLYDLIHELASIEDHYTALEVARARRLPKRTVVSLATAGQIPGTHKVGGNKWRISASGLREWDRQTCVTPLPESNGNGHH